MSVDQVVEKLKAESASNPVSNAVFHLFAVRKRTRSTVWLTNLYTQMTEAGFKYSKEQYAETLKFMASVGIGILKYTPRGKVKGIFDVKMTLQSIGEAACGIDPRIKSFSTRKRFYRLRVARPEVLTKEVETPKDIDINLDVSINGKVIQIHIPTNFTKDDIALLIAKWR